MKKTYLIALLIFISFNYSVAQETINPISNPFLEYNASIAGKTNGYITSDEIIQAKTLLLDSAIRNVYHIISYKMTFSGKGRNITEFENQKSGELTQAMLEELNKATSGCQIFFEFIKAADSTNSIESKRNIHPMKFTIK